MNVSVQLFPAFPYFENEICVAKRRRAEKDVVVIIYLFFVFTNWILLLVLLIMITVIHSEHSRTKSLYSLNYN